MREKRDPSDEEFPAFPGEEGAVTVGERESGTQEGELPFAASFEAPSALLQKPLTEENVDLLGLNSDIPLEQEQPISETSSSTSNADLLNNLFVGSAPQIPEESTGDLLGQGTSFFLSSLSVQLLLRCLQHQLILSTRSQCHQVLRICPYLVQTSLEAC